MCERPVPLAWDGFWRCDHNASKIATKCVIKCVVRSSVLCEESLAVIDARSDRLLAVIDCSQ